MAWAQYALAHLKPGGRAVLAMPPSAAAVPSGREARADMLRQGVLRTVIALPVAVAPPYVPLHLWVLERPDGKAEPDLLALFVEATPKPGPTGTTRHPPPRDDARGQLASLHAQHSNRRRLSARIPGKRVVCSGGGQNAKWCVTRVADLLDDTACSSKSERLDETVDLTPARVRAHFSAWHREKDKESARRRGSVQPRNPPATFLHSRLGRFAISQDIDGVAKILQRLDWLGGAGDGREVEPQLGLPADPWRTAAVPELARLGLLRYRHARTGHAELLRVGDVLVPATVTKGAQATVVGGDRAGDPAGPGVHVIRPNPAHLNSWFLAGFLLSPGNLRRATGNHVDVRQLEAPLLPLADQERYAGAFRNMRSLESITGQLKDRAALMAGNLTAGLASGDFRPERETSPGEVIRSRDR